MENVCISYLYSIKMVLNAQEKNPLSLLPTPQAYLHSEGKSLEKVRRFSSTNPAAAGVGRSI